MQLHQSVLPPHLLKYHPYHRLIIVIIVIIMSSPIVIIIINIISVDVIMILVLSTHKWSYTKNIPEIENLFK